MLLTVASHFIFSVLCPRSCDIPFMVWKDSTTTVYFLLVRYSNKAREEEKFSTYNLHTTPSPLLVKCLTIVCVGVILLVAFLDSFYQCKVSFYMCSLSCQESCKFSGQNIYSSYVHTT